MQLKAHLLATEQSLSEKKDELDKVKTTYPFNLDQYISLSEEIESLEKGVVSIKNIQSEFGFKPSSDE